MEDFWMGNILDHCRCFKGGWGQKWWGVLPIIGNALEGWKPNGWRALPIIEMLQEMEIQWMESAPLRLDHITFKRCFANGEYFPLSLPMSTKKGCFTNKERSLCGMSSNWILASCKFFFLSVSPWFETSWKFRF
jgi:hypothetical protein